MNLRNNIHKENKLINTQTKLNNFATKYKMLKSEYNVSLSKTYSSSGSTFLIVDNDNHGAVLDEFIISFPLLHLVKIPHTLYRI